MTTKQPDWEAIKRASPAGLSVVRPERPSFYCTYLTVALTSN